MPTLEGAKPCPFCGNDVINLDVIDGEVTPWCTNCSAQGPSKHFGPDGTAAGAWNDTRSCESDDLDAMRARAEAAEAALAAANARADHATHRAAKAEVDVDEADVRCDGFARLLSEGLEIVESLSAGHDVWAAQVRRALGV